MPTGCITDRIRAGEGLIDTVSCMNWDPEVWPSDRRIRRGLELIGGTVKRRRERLALSQRQLQQLSGVQQSGISRLENGKLTGIRWQRFARLVDALDGLEYVAPPREHPPWPGPASRRPPSPDDQDDGNDADD
jgi:DNA-binding Xre family transcriptional regulator